jgi:hypothetical protein
VTYFTNWGYNNYHSLQTELSVRPLHGMSGSITYNWSKNLGITNTLTDPTNRAADYTAIGNNPGHSLRSNGTFELPFGPNKPLFGNASGFIARAIEKWQLGVIYNLSSGYPLTISANDMLYNNGVPDVRHPIDFNKLKGARWGFQNGNFLEGRYFDNGDVFVSVDDPLCYEATLSQNLYNVSGNAAAAPRCTLNALAMIVPVGTPDSAPVSTYTRSSTDNRNVQIVLQHPRPGTRGNLGRGTIIGPGSWRFDANLGKTFRISESKSLQVRFDALNVLNHPQPNNGGSFAPTLDINANSDTFGRFATKTGGRSLQGQLRLTF